VVSALAGRIDGWELRLDLVMSGARAKRYVLGEWDCFRLACAVIEALTGEDRWPEFSGYTTKRQALHAIARYGRTFEDAGDWFFRTGRMQPSLARRGDIVALQDEDGEKHLGVCLGHRIAFMSDSGLEFVLLTSPLLLCAWRVG
jgi:hypothetical protein